MPLDGTSVLVVDDEPDNVEILAFVLADAGATVRTARGAREALDILAEWKPDVLLFDLSMPEMNGFDLLVTVRHIERLRDVPAVAITGSTSSSDKERAFSSGFQAYMTKPYRRDALVDLIGWLAPPDPLRKRAPLPASSSITLP